MNVYHNMTDGEFIAVLREAAIFSKQAPLVIDKIDRLRGADEDAQEITELEIKIEELEEKVIALEEKLAQKAA